MKAEGTVAEVLAGRARYHVAHTRCEDFARSIPDGSVNLHWIDPPYFRVVDEEWDRAWKSEADFLAWLRGVVAEAARTLAPNGSLYLFASPQMGGRVETIAAERLRVLNAITWAKPSGAHKRHSREECRVWRTRTERVIFAETRGHLGGSVLGDAIRAARLDAGLTQDALDVAIGRTRERDPSKGSGLTRLQEPGERTPNADDFAAALRACGDPRPDAVLRAEYFRLLRPFSAPESFSEVWEHDPAPPGLSRHPCEKPAAMLRDVVRASSRPGDVVCEWFGGSFRMAEAALAEGRRYIGCDADAHWAAVGEERARAAVNGTAPAVAARRAKAPADARQPSLFDVRRPEAT